MAHFTCVGATVAELRATLDEMQEAGIDNVLALRGDPPAGQEQWTKTEGGLEYSRELVELIAADYPFAIGAACFPETHIHAVSPEDDLEHLAEKVRAGVRLPDHTAVLRQRPLLRLRRARTRGRDRGADHPGHHADHAASARSSAWPSSCGASIPDGLRRELHARGEDPEAVLDFGVAYATLQCAELLAGGAPGIHFYTLNRSPATRAILSALKLARPWEGALLSPRLDLQPLRHARRAVGGLVAHVHGVVLAVGAHAPGAQQPAPAADVVLAQLALEHQRAFAHDVVRAQLLAHAVEVHLVWRAHLAGELHDRAGHGLGIMPGPRRTLGVRVRAAAGREVRRSPAGSVEHPRG